MMILNEFCGKFVEPKASTTSGKSSGSAPVNNETDAKRMAKITQVKDLFADLGEGFIEAWRVASRGHLPRGTSGLEGAARHKTALCLSASSARAWRPPSVRRRRRTLVGAQSLRVALPRSSALPWGVKKNESPRIASWRGRAFVRWPQYQNVGSRVNNL